MSQPASQPDRRRWHRDPADEERREQVYRHELASYLRDEQPCKRCEVWQCPVCFSVEDGGSIGIHRLPLGDIPCRRCGGTKVVTLRCILEDFGQDQYDHLCDRCAEWGSWRD